MDILKSYLQELDNKADVKLKRLSFYWSRIFSSLKRKEGKLKFISDRSDIDWDTIVDRVLEDKLAMLSRKRRRLHINLHLQEDASVTDLVAASAAVRPRDKIDALFMGADDEFDTTEIKLVVQTWMDNAQYVKELHKQDLLYYRIMDFTTSINSAGIYNILKDKYSLALHFYKTFQNDINEVTKEDCEAVKDYTSSVLEIKRGNFARSLSKAKKRRRHTANSPKYEKYTLRVLSLFKNLCSEGENELLDEDMNENEFTMCFIYPILNNLFKYSKKDMIIRWGEAKLISKKKEEHAALDDNHRRSPGPSIDLIFRTKHGKIEFAIGEISGAPTVQSQEHYVGDRNKIAKNMKSMLKYIISLKSELNDNDANKIQIYGIHIYQFEVRIYRLMYHRGIYVFTQVDSFMIPVLSITFKDQLPDFISQMWKLKNYLTESHKSIMKYLTTSSGAQSTENTISAPYASPQKRQ